jgi:hypothetical protein
MSLGAAPIGALALGELPSTGGTSGFFLPDPRFEMPSLFYPKRKPVGPVKVNWGHPDAQGLKFATLFTSEGMPDLVGGLKPTWRDSVSKVTSGGQGANNNVLNGNAEIEFPANESYWLHGDVDWACFVLLDIEAFDSSTAEYTILAGSDNNREGTFNFNSSGVGNGIRFSYRAPSTTFNYASFSGSVTPSSGVHSFAIRKKGLTFYLYIDGVFQSSIILSNQPLLASNMGTSYIGFGGGGHTAKDNRNLCGTYLAGYIWREEIPNDFQSIHANPYQILEPK